MVQIMYRRGTFLVRMPAPDAAWLARLEDFSRLTYCNPFVSERRKIEARLLGTPRKGVWVVGQDSSSTELLGKLAQQTLAQLTADRSRIPASQIEDLALYVLYERHRDSLEALILGRPVKLRAMHETLAAELGAYDVRLDAAEVLGRFFQICRAFQGIYNSIVGGTPAAAGLRANIWESIFTHDPRRFWKTLQHQTADFPTLIAGPSGSGKELVARAIAAGRFIPFNARRGEFEDRLEEIMLSLNVAALSPTLIESELFGHRRGAFTGALEDRSGWLEACGERGVVFLDEIGELDTLIQVKLLRVLQEKTFQRIGETKTRLFRGKIIAATNRDLAQEMQAGHFRRDLYYRLCADIIHTPSLTELLCGDREELGRLIQFIAAKLLPAEQQQTQLVEQTLKEIGRNVGWSYEWTGNFRELEQCTRNVLIRGNYQPLKFANSASSLAEEIAGLQLTADELLDRYCQQAYEQLGSYRRAADRLKIDRRTLRARIHTNSQSDD